jgi:hypothetical protein
LLQTIAELIDSYYQSRLFGDKQLLGYLILTNVAFTIDSSVTSTLVDIKKSKASLIQIAKACPLCISISRNQGQITAALPH